MIVLHELSTDRRDSISASYLLGFYTDKVAIALGLTSSHPEQRS